MEFLTNFFFFFFSGPHFLFFPRFKDSFSNAVQCRGVRPLIFLLWGGEGNGSPFVSLYPFGSVSFSLTRRCDSFSWVGQKFLTKVDDPLIQGYGLLTVNGFRQKHGRVECEINRVFEWLIKNVGVFSFALYSYACFSGEMRHEYYIGRVLTRIFVG